MPAPSAYRAALLDHPLLREGRLWQAGSLGRSQARTLASGFAALDADDTWRPLIDPPVFTERTLPEGLSWSGLRLDGQDAPQPRLQFGTQTPEYELRVATPRGIALLTGKANGDVLLTPPDAPPRS